MASAHTNEDQDDLLILGSLRSFEKARSPGPKRLPGVQVLIDVEPGSRLVIDSSCVPVSAPQQLAQTGFDPDYRSGLLEVFDRFLRTDRYAPSDEW